MATEATVQILATSVDAAGLSVVTSLRTLDALRQGSIYNNTTLAAGVPVHFHALQNGRHLVLFSSRWTDATVGTLGPQSYTAYTESSDPCWVTVFPATGSAGPVDAIPTRLPGDRILNGAVSRIDYLFTVGTYSDYTTDGLVQFHRVARSGSLLLVAEELLPSVGDVVFGAGCYIDADNLVVFGLDGEGVLYQARKHWGRVGVNASITPWQYRGEKGWSSDSDSLSPLLDVAGDSITSLGPVSVGRFRDRLWLSTVVDDDGDMAAKVYTARAFDRWRPDGSLVALGTPDAYLAGTYLGGTLYFQAHLHHNTAALPTTATAAIPYVTSVRTVDEGGYLTEESILTSWGLWPTAAKV